MRKARKADNKTQGCSCGVPCLAKLLLEREGIKVNMRDEIGESIITINNLI